MSVTAVPIRPIQKGAVTKLWVGLGALSLAAAGLAWIGTAGHRAADPATFLADNAESDGVVTTASGLQYKVLKAGSGPRPSPADIAVVDYEGRLTDGTVFDASAQHGGPATFPIAGVVPGFSEALQLMQKGATYRIWMPPELGYGSAPQGDVIPANSVLEFDLTLRDFRALTPEEIQQIQLMQQMQQQQAQGQQGGGGF